MYCYMERPKVASAPLLNSKWNFRFIDWHQTCYFNCRKLGYIILWEEMAIVSPEELYGSQNQDDRAEMQFMVLMILFHHSKSALKPKFRSKVLDSLCKQYTTHRDIWISKELKWVLIRQDPVSTKQKTGLPVIPHSWFCLEEGIAYRFDHYGAVNNHFPVQ